MRETEGRMSDEDPIEEHVKVLNLGCIVAPLARKAWLAACVVTWRPVMVTLGRAVMPLGLLK